LIDLFIYLFIFGAKFLTLANVDEKKVMPYDDFGFFIPSIILRFCLGKKRKEISPFRNNKR
jgi:hypothetical protein